MDQDVSFRERLLAAEPIRKRLSEAQLDDLLSYEYHLRHVDTAFRRIGLDS